VNNWEYRSFQLKSRPHRNNIKAVNDSACLIQLVEYVRISVGTAMKLGLEKGRLPSHFTTAFLMTYSETGCTANCAFCPQAAGSTSSPEMLSRIGWPKYALADVIDGFSKNLEFKRVCIQSLNYPHAVEDVASIVGGIKGMLDSRISVCIHPVSHDEMIRLHSSGIERIGIAIDACTPSLFEEIKGKARKSQYSWDTHIEAIKDAQSVFGVDRVTTHLIVGLGESELELSNFLFDMKEMGVRVGLFAFTAIKGTELAVNKPPQLGKYRRVQILRDLIVRDLIQRNELRFDAQGGLRFPYNSGELKAKLASGNAFRVTGCPGCNRPYYNERPRGTMYNYPRPLRHEEIEKALEEAGLVN
jgi:biotin synthase-related radical SAM superfamily protein